MADRPVAAGNYDVVPFVDGDPWSNPNSNPINNKELGENALWQVEQLGRFLLSHFHKHFGCGVGRGEGAVEMAVRLLKDELPPGNRMWQPVAPKE